MPQTFWSSLCLSLLAAAVPTSVAHAQGTRPARSVPTTSQEHAELVRLFNDWRTFVQPTIARGVPDYGAAAMARKAADLPDYRARLKAIDIRAWPAAAQNDYRLVEAEMNGFDFYLRILKPWARDPGFYQTVFGEESDVPAHEGPSASPTIDLFKVSYPLSRPDDRRLTEWIGGVTAMLAAARVNLADSNAADLWDGSVRERVSGRADGTTYSGKVWTGTTASGGASPKPLGFSGSSAPVVNFGGNGNTGAN